MKCTVGHAFAFAALLSLTITVQGAFALTDLQLYIPKAVYSSSEQMELYGVLANLSNSSSPIAGASVELNITNSTATISSYTLTTNSQGRFYSQSTYFANSSLVRAPNATGQFNITAYFTSEGASSGVEFSVIANKSVDSISVTLGKSRYYASENATITIMASITSGGNQVAVSGVQVNGTIRDSQDLAAGTFGCMTSTDGKCSASFLAPSTSGDYYVEANSYAGYSNFQVIPFDVFVATKESTGTTLKSIFKKGDNAYVEVRVTYNSTQPSGEYTVSGRVEDVNSTTVATLSGFALQSNNSYINRELLAISNSYLSGTYRIIVSVQKNGGDTVNATSIFEVRDWTLSFSKASTGSGFDYRYTAFPNTTVSFEAFPTDRSSGAVITGLESNFTITLKNSVGIQISGTSATYNSSCRCYKFNITTPANTGNYILGVSVIRNETISVEKIITVADMTASAIASDASGVSKEVFTTNEFIYIKPLASNRSSSINVSQAEIISIRLDDGTQKNYTNTSNWAGMNLSDSALQWMYNSTTRQLKLDPPSSGGQYIVEIAVQNKSASAETKFTIRPYDICTSAKGSADDSATNDYWWQFKTTDTIYMQVAIEQAQATSTSSTTNSSSSSFGYYGSGYGQSTKCTIASTEQPVTNATLHVQKVLNIENNKEEELNQTVSVCQTLSTSGTYLCTIKANDSKWDGGKHSVSIEIVGPDGTAGTGYGQFEARSFYIYGWTSSWRNKPDSNLSFNINMYSAGSNWWSNNQGISATATLEKIEYYGKQGEWIFPPINYDYNVTGLNGTTITNGAGTMSLPAGRAPNGQWDTGSYTAVIKGVNEAGDIDYGRLWFEIRRWDAYTTPVEAQNTTYRYKYTFNTAENISLYVKLSNAGDNWGSSGQSLGGNISIGIKKIEYYTTWPPKELNTSLYSYSTVYANQTSPPYYEANPSSQPRYVLNISRTQGRWESGYYNIILDINGTETGYGWFEARAFNVEATHVDANGTSIYNTRGKGSLYFNVTTTLNRKWLGYYSTADYINTTITDLTLHSWRESGDSWTQINLDYPQDINMSVTGSTSMAVNGTVQLNVTYNGGAWPAGWYYGEVSARNSDNETVFGNVYFNVKPFRTQYTTAQYTIGTTGNLSATLAIYDPDWSRNTIIPGNYSITSVVEDSWQSGSRTVTNISNYSITGGTSFNGSTVNLTIRPNNGRWSAGYKNLKITVRDSTENSSTTEWLSFRAVPFSISASRTSAYTIGLGNNVTINISLTLPNTNTPAQGNITSIYYWGWPSTTYYNYTINGCTSNCLINGSGIVTVIAPPGGWDEGYHYMYFLLSEATNSSTFDDWNSVYFYSRPTLNAYMSVTGPTGNWVSAFDKTDNVTIYMYSLTDLNNNVVTANVTSVQYAYSSSGCMSDSCRQYQSAASWNVVDISSGATISNNSIRSSGYIRVQKPSGGWSYGDYYLKVTVTSGSDSAIIKNGYFTVRDKTAPNITITSPALGQIINTTTATYIAVTTESARCSFSTRNYGLMCPASNATYCNSTLYSGSTSYYSYASGWSSDVISDGITHSYSYPTAGMASQHYILTLDCFDSDWNYATNSTVFYINASPQNSSLAWSRANVSTMYAGANAIFSIFWNSTYNLSGYIFSWNNGAGWSNDSFANFTGIVAWSNVTKALNSTVNTTVSWRVYANDSHGTWNITDLQQFTTSTTAPKWSRAGNSSNLAGTNSTFSVLWNDTVSLSAYIFSWNNGAGWSNDTAVNFTAAPSWSNVTKTLNSSANITISWKIYSNNSLGQWNITDTQNFTTIANAAPAWSRANSSNMTAGSNNTFSAYWSDNAGLSGYIFSWTNGGTAWQNDSFTNLAGTSAWSNVSKVLNSTINATISWKIYANNSNNLWNITSLQQFNTTT